MMNFLALLGWSYSDSEEVFAPHELVERFSLERVSRSGAVFDYEKLDWLSGFYLRKMGLGDFTDFILPFWVRAGWITEPEVPARSTYLMEVARLHQERIRYGAQIVEKTDYYFLEDFPLDGKAAKKLKKREDGAEILTAYARALEADAFEDPQAMEDQARAWTEERNMGFGALVHPVRAAITGKTATPGLFDVMIVLGKECVLRRLREAAHKLERGEI
jgi:glutamyl/glutaminyl-tRNA synthetase